MQFYKYWTSAESTFDVREDTITRRAFGYSNEGIEDALRVARERAKKAAEAWQKKKQARGVDAGEDQYYGAGRAIREDIIEEFREGDETVAVISRNSYGCLVLNTTEVFFADVDLPPPVHTNGFLNLLFKWFAKKEVSPPPSFEQQLIEKIQKLIKDHGDLGLRLYRTAGGYRIVVTSQTIRAGYAQSDILLSELGADLLYVSLCRSQDCYRARLSPKHWRFDLPKPPTRFPFLTEEHALRFEHWLKDYEQKSAAYSTCVLVGDFGSTELHPRVASILKLHDHFAIQDDKPLA